MNRHHHDHDHGHGSAVASKAFAIAIGLNGLYVAVELAFGLLAGSLGLVADAAHNASDVLSLAVAWIAAYLATRPPSNRFTYGLKRAPILGSLFNAGLLFAAMVAIAYEAAQRFINPSTVAGETVIWVAGVGLLINAGTAMLFMRGAKADLNIRGAFLHMAADALVTLGVLVAGAIILVTGWRWVDPAISLIVVLVVLWSTWDLARDAVKLSLDVVPVHVDIDAVRRYLEQIDGVRELHDLHIWPMSTTETALTAHLVMPEGSDQPDVLLRRISRELHERFGIEHATVQIERGDTGEPCDLASPKVV